MKTILIATSDESTREDCERLLRQNGYRVRLAASGSDAIRLSRILMPDGILLDRDLSDVSAEEVADRLRSDPQTMRIRVIGPHTADDLTAASRATLFDRTVSSPFDSNALLDAVTLELGPAPQHS